MLLAASGIFLSTLDALEIRVTSPQLGNLSEQVGLISTYIGLAALVYAVFFVRDETILLSAAAKCILSLTGLSMGLLAAVKYIQYSPIEWDEDEDSDDESFGAASLTKNKSVSLSKSALKLAQHATQEPMLVQAQSTCDFVPMICVVCFYMHFRLLRVGSQVGASA